MRGEQYDPPTIKHKRVDWPSKVGQDMSVHENTSTWEALRISVNKAAKDNIPVRVRQTKKQWMTKEILTMMDERRKANANEEDIDTYARK